MIKINNEQTAYNLGYDNPSLLFRLNFSAPHVAVVNAYGCGQMDAQSHAPRASVYRAEDYDFPTCERKQSPSPQPNVAPDAAARLERILRVGRSMKWTPDGAPALDDEDTAVALGELFQIFFQDAVDRALATTEGKDNG